jgi:hypothetical protein
MGFIDFIIKPSFELLTRVCPTLTLVSANADENLQNWKQEIDNYEELMK